MGKESFFNSSLRSKKRKEKDICMNICLYRNRERPLDQQTLIAVGIKEISSVWEAGAVGVVVNGPYSWFIPSAVTPGHVDWITHAAVG